MFCISELNVDTNRFLLVWGIIDIPQSFSSTANTYLFASLKRGVCSTSCVALHRWSLWVLPITPWIHEISHKPSYRKFLLSLERDWMLKCSYRLKNWQRQQCYQNISEHLESFKNILIVCLEIVWYLTIRLFMGYWNGSKLPIFTTDFYQYWWHLRQL